MTGPVAQPAWQVEVAATLDGWPSGVAVSESLRCFVALPQALGQTSEATLVEIIDGSGRPFEPNGTTFTSIQGLRYDAGTLYALDSGSEALSGCDPDRAALWAVDLQTNAVRRYGFDPLVLSETSYLNDLAVDAAHGVAYLVDSGARRPNALIVLDLEGGRAIRVLEDHPSVRAAPPVSPQAFEVGGQSLLRDGFEIGVTAAARSADGTTIYWTKPDTLCTAPASALRDPSLPSEELDHLVTCWPSRDFAADGIDQDARGRLLLTDVTNSAIVRFDPRDGTYQRLVSDRRLDWPDGIAAAPDGSVLVTASQIHRSPMFTEGDDRRHPPFLVLRLLPRNE